MPLWLWGVSCVLLWAIGFGMGYLVGGIEATLFERHKREGQS